jgi:DNA-binding transcriptional MerR regulator|tara:strand:+ start:6041 stop:6328 length:288 start_codon:yes stop_codon:yes gene_type:complete
MDQIVDFERRIELALDEIERFVSEYSISPSLKTERDNDRLQDLAAENQLLTAQIESLKTQHNNELQALIAEREEERETVKSLYKRLTEVVESPGD